MKKGILFGVMGLTALGIAAYGTGVFASQGENFKFGPNYSPERHETMTKAFENRDYASWKTQMGNRGPGRVVTEQNFARFAQMHELMLQGKNEEANEIRRELGLGAGNRQGRGMGNGFRNN